VYRENEHQVFKRRISPGLLDLPLHSAAGGASSLSAGGAASAPSACPCPDVTRKKTSSSLLIASPRLEMLRQLPLPLPLLPQPFLP